MAQYDDIYMRAFQGDSGQVPRPSSYGMSNSPDLIPYGTSPVDPATFLTDTSWNTTYNATLTANMANYMYMRAQNLGNDPSTGEFTLYYSPGSMLLWPSQWSKNKLLTQTGADKQTLAFAGKEKKVLPSPFVWKAKNDDHYCLVGMVSTAKHPASIPADGSIQDFANWIASNGCYAWHNMAVTSSGAPTIADRSWYAQGDTADLMRFDIVCTNVPVNSKVQFSCGASGAKPPILLNPTTVTTPDSFIAGMKSTVEAGFEAFVDYAYTAPPGQSNPPPGFNLSIEVSYATQSGMALHKYAKTLEQMGFPKPEDYIARAKAMAKWDKVKMKDHHERAEYLLKEHTDAGTYKKSRIGPIRYYTVGAFTTAAQKISTQ